jgi:hypothetical protein
MKITVNGCGSVTLTHAGQETTYYCPPDGGYIRTYPDNRQVCDRLQIMGSTLISPSRAALPEVIRREYRRAYASARRELNR